VGPSNGSYGGYATRRNQENHHSIRHPAFVTLRLVTTISPPANPLFCLECLGPEPLHSRPPGTPRREHGGHCVQHALWLARAGAKHFAQRDFFCARVALASSKFGRAMHTSYLVIPMCPFASNAIGSH